MSNISFSNKRGQYFDADNDNFRVINEIGITGDWASDPIVIVDTQFNLQVNVVGSSSFDISIEQSIDCVYWGDFAEDDGSGTPVDPTLKTGVGSGDSPFTYSICGGRFRYVRVVIKNLVGSANVEVYKI